jgi:ADP-ribosyl-[dinitrogen reductase] hydrolase
MQARLTHDTPEGIGASAAVALMSHFFLYARGPKAQLVPYLATHVPDAPWHTPWKGTVDTQGYSCVRAALTALLQSSSLSEILERCIAFGGDTDTVACIALGVCASSAEFSHDLPAYLFTGLESGPFGLDYLRDLDSRLLAQVNHS